MDTPTSSLKSLTTLCLESLARSIGKQDLSALPGDLSERLQATLISMNALNDDTLVSSTSINQTCLNIPFFISNDTQESNGPSPASVLAAIKKCDASLTSLNCNGHQLTPELLDCITSEPLRSNLVELQLVGCHVPLTAAAKILSHCPRLQSLNLSGNPEVNDALFVFPTSFNQSISSRNAPTAYALRNGFKLVNSPLPPRHASRKRPSTSPQVLENIVSHTSSIHTSPQVTSSKASHANSMDLDQQSPSFFDSHTTNSSEDMGSYENDHLYQDDLLHEPIAKRSCPSGEANTLSDNISSLVPTASFGLSSLILSGTNISDKSIDAISKLYPHLLDLDISHCSDVTDLTPILLRCTQLRSLNISGTSVSSHSEKLIKFGVASENGVNRADGLFENPLDRSSSDVGTSAPHHRYKFLRHLKSLIFCGSGRLDAGFVVWMEACGDSLLELRLANKSLPEDLIGHIHARNARVQVMNGQQDLLTPEQEQYLPLIVRILVPCRRLQVLDIHGTNVSSNAIVMLFEGLKPHWTATCEEFDVVNCDEIDLKTLLHVFGLASLVPQAGPNASATPPGQKQTPSSPTWPKLKTLRISGGKHVETLSGPELPAIGLYGCPQLEHLVLNNTRAGRALLRPVHVGQILMRFPALRSVEFWCCSSISFQLAAIIPQLCKQIRSVLLCVVGENGAAGPVLPLQAPMPHRNHNHNHNHNGNPVAVVSAAAEVLSMPAFLTNDQVRSLQRSSPLVEWKLWRHSVESSRNFQHIRPLNCASSFEPVAILRPEQPTNCLTVSVEATGATDASLPLRSRLIKASVSVDGIPIWNGEKSASMHHLSQSIWGLVTHNAGALPLIEDWCCACNIEEFNGVLFYDDSEYVYWDVLEPGPKASFKFHKAQYVSAIASAMQQQWSVFTNILPKEELVQQALLFTQQHAWHQKLLDQSKSSSMPSPLPTSQASSPSIKVIPPTRG